MGKGTRHQGRRANHRLAVVQNPTGAAPRGQCIGGVNKRQFRFQAEPDLLRAIFQDMVVLGIVQQAVLGKIAGDERSDA